MSEWSDLRYFLALEREGTLAGAARALKCESTTVGRRIAALEQSLGARLFDRKTDGFVLTIAGERILEHARAVETHVNEVERTAAGEDARVEGAVRLATSENLAVAFLLRVLAPLHERHPGIVLEVQTGVRPVDLLNREADLAVRVGPGMRPQQQSLVAKKLAAIGMTIYASASYVERYGTPRVGDGLAGHVVCGYCGDIAKIAPGEWLEEHAAKARVAMRASSMLCIARAVSAGVGLSMLPCFLGDTAPGLQRLAPPPLVSAEAWLVVHPDLQKTARVRAVIDFLVEAMELQGAALGGA